MGVWTTPRTWATGELVTPSMMNTHVRDNLGALRITYSVGAPVSPGDGDIWMMVDSLTNPTYECSFRYSVGSTSSFKWESTGGTGILSTSSGGVSSVGSTLAWSASGASISVPRAGDYEAIGMLMVTETGSQTQYEYGVGNGSPVAIIANIVPSNGQAVGPSIETLAGLGAGATVAMYHRTQGSGVTVASSFNRVMVRPKRVS